MLLPPLAHADPARVARQVPGRLGPQVGGHVYLVLRAAAGRGEARLVLQVSQSRGEKVDGAARNGFGFFFGDGLNEGARWGGSEEKVRCYTVWKVKARLSCVNRIPSSSRATLKSLIG